MKKKPNSYKKMQAEARRLEQLIKRLERKNPQGMRAFRNLGLVPPKRGKHAQS